MTLMDEVTVLRTENAALRTETANLREQLATALERVMELEEQLHQIRSAPPAFVKANRPKRAESTEKRKKRAPQHNTSRRRQTPTKIERHALDRCPVCTYPLRGESVDYTRQVIEIPPPPPVEVIEHQVLKRWCPHCTTWRSPQLDLHGQVLGQGRIGVRIASLVAYLRTTLRMTIRHIEAYLDTVHHLQLSSGEIVELLHQVRQMTQTAIDGLKTQVRQSPVIHADETGWRQDGQNGYIWTLATPGTEPIRYYEHDASRGQPVLTRLLDLKEGQRSTACLVSDFYAGYNGYAGPQQRCWTHLLRALHELKEEYAQNTDVVTWAGEVRRLYDDAQAWRSAHPSASAAERMAIYQVLVRRAVALGKQYAQVYDHPCNALAKRLLRHQDELFQFVLRDGVSASNNLAERTIRPLVVIRKISGGTRSDKGTKTRLGLASLFGTWSVRGLNPFTECFRLLSHAPP